MKKIFAFFICFAMLVPLFASCDKKDAASELVLVDFESYDEMWKGLRSDFIGKCYITNDEKGVTHGENCFYLEYTGLSDNAWFTRTYDLEKIPSIRFFKQSETIPSVDFNYVTGFSIDVYNDTDEKIDLIFGLDRMASAYDVSSIIYTDLKILQPKTLNRVVYPVDREILAANGNDVCSYVFYVRDPKAGEHTTKLYFDNFRVNLSDVAYTPIAADKTPENNEILSFSSIEDYDYTRIYSTVNVLNGYYEYVSSMPSSDCGGLRYTFRDFNGSGGLPNTDFYPANEKVGFAVKENLLQKLKLAGSQRIYIDAFNASSVERRIYIGISDGSGKNLCAYADVKPFAWMRVYLDGVSGFGGEINELRVYTNTYTITEEFEIYFKNLGYER